MAEVFGALESLQSLQCLLRNSWELYGHDSPVENQQKIVGGVSCMMVESYGLSVLSHVT